MSYNTCCIDESMLQFCQATKRICAHFRGPMTKESNGTLGRVLGSQSSLCVNQAVVAPSSKRILKLWQTQSLFKMSSSRNSPNTASKTLVSFGKIKLFPIYQHYLSYIGSLFPASSKQKFNSISHRTLSATTVL